MKKAKIISLDITLGAYRQVLGEIISLGKARMPSFVCFANVHMTVEAAWNEQVKDGISAANIITADGMPVVKAIGYKYGIKQDRIAGMDAMPDLLAMAETENLSVFLFGTTKDVLELIEKKIGIEHPKLRVAGSISPPFGENLNEQSEKYIDEINHSDADIVMVALGCPKQEIWMEKHSRHIKATLLGLGGAFPVYAGLVKRAPRWMQRFSLEWLFRLGQDPRRLFKRYFLTNTIFLVLITAEILSSKLKGSS
ncbi:WecB/TagA/CpsF family glycosyltransferase [Flavobacteriales bacterium AH-315-E23]|nr:WecB/TagA/CpsF family glycosyltransferase [Flavobacteriales bacterium AH-315-E23]